MGSEKSLVQHFAKNDPFRTLSMVLLLAFAGLAEGLGVAASLPLLDQVISPEAEPSGLGAAVVRAFEGFGLEASIGTLLVALVILFALKGLLTIQAMIQVGVVVAKVTMELRLRLLKAVSQAEWRQVLAYPTGFITNAISRDSLVSAAAYREFCQVIAEGAQVIVYLALSFMVSWQAASLALFVGLGIMALLHHRLSGVRNAGEDQTRILRSILARLTDALPSLKALKAMGREQYLIPLLEQETRAFFRAQKKVIVQVLFMDRGREPVIVAALALGLWLVLTLTTVGSASLFVLALLFYRTVTSITNVQHRWATVVVGESAFTSIMEHILAAEGAKEAWVSGDSGQSPTFKDEIRLEGLGFSYGENMVLKEVDASLRAGSFVLLVGPSGSGKTTLTDLVTGLLRPAEGRILVDGQDLADLDMGKWRHSIGYVPQEPMLFSDTIRNNIQLGKEGISEEEVRQALREAEALDFVDRLSGQVDHRIGEEGTTLSGGQRQRLAIARALVSRPDLLILDEPTTALDTKAEKGICDTISRLRGTRTILAISHQPAIRELADEVWEIRDASLKVSFGPGSAHSRATFDT